MPTGGPRRRRLARDGRQHLVHQRAACSAATRSTTRRARRARAARPGARGSSPAAILAAAKRVSSASWSYSGPSWATSSGSGSSGSASAGLQTSTSTLTPSPRPASVSSSLPSTLRRVEPGGRLVGRRAAAPTCRRTRPARCCGLPGSSTYSVPPSSCSTSSWYSSRSTSGRSSSSRHSPSWRAKSCAGRSEVRRTALYSARRGRRAAGAPPDDGDYCLSAVRAELRPVPAAEDLRERVHRIERVEHVEHLAEERRRRVVLGVERRPLPAEPSRRAWRTSSW